MIHLILSLDYEIFGNGAGDVMRDVICPTERLLDICDRHGAKMTIMFEVGEYWAFERYDTQLRQDLGYSPAERIREQIVDAIGRGHDVQLHLHPQWIGAEYGKRTWRLGNSFWRLADLPGGLGDRDQLKSITGALDAGKRTLEEMIEPVKADYECTCFRAGGLYAQPSREIIAAMRRVGLRADSSLVKGYRKSTPFAVDYTHVETNKTAWWTTHEELTDEGAAGENIIELSISCRMEPYWMSFKRARRRAVSRMVRLEKPLREQGHTGVQVSCVPPLGELLRRLVRKQPSIFDFCRLSRRDMLRRIRQHARYIENPVVVMGHSKDFVNDHEFDRFLGTLCKDHEVAFRAMSDYVRDIYRTQWSSAAAGGTVSGLKGSKAV